MLAVASSIVAAEIPVDRFGGTTAIKREATGHFRVEKMNDRWMFITPEGHGYLALGRITSARTATTAGSTAKPSATTCATTARRFRTSRPA
ncbi:MAG: hypothetical protein EXS37_16450 [Opitutus sp.]|nr:hypothetical protein [Opitutus sp.]